MKHWNLLTMPSILFPGAQGIATRTPDNENVHPSTRSLETSLSDKNIVVRWWPHLKYGLRNDLEFHIHQLPVCTALYLHNPYLKDVRKKSCSQFTNDNTGWVSQHSGQSSGKWNVSVIETFKSSAFLGGSWVLLWKLASKGKQMSLFFCS
jgi:hypothetical protein